VTQTAAAATAVDAPVGPAFAVDRPYRLHAQVALRPEPFGALAYHYGNRRLVFLRSPAMVALVRSLDGHPSAAAALDAAVAEGLVTDRQRTAHERALASLFASEILCEREPS
jgi:putative mycofactocin binding protein MftB